MAKKLKKLDAQAASLSDLTDPELAEACLAHWAHLGEVLPRLAEREVRRLLGWELSHRRNPSIARRLLQRLCRLQTHREQAELEHALATGTDWVVPRA